MGWVCEAPCLEAPFCGCAGECGGRTCVRWLALPTGPATSLLAVALGEPLQMNVSRCGRPAQGTFPFPAPLPPGPPRGLQQAPPRDASYEPGVPTEILSCHLKRLQKPIIGKGVIGSGVGTQI